MSMHKMTEEKRTLLATAPETTPDCLYISSG